jgi:hypothetical protein
VLNAGKRSDSISQWLVQLKERVGWHGSFECLTFEVRGGRKRAKPACGCPFERGSGITLGDMITIESLPSAIGIGD